MRDFKKFQFNNSAIQIESQVGQFLDFEVEVFWLKNFGKLQKVIYFLTLLLHFAKFNLTFASQLSCCR